MIKPSLFKNNHLLFLAVYFILSLVVTLVWFKAGYLFGGGDVGLPTYNPKRILEITQYIWWEAMAPGTAIPQGVTVLPLMYILSLLQMFSFDGVLIQATLFFILLVMMGLGVYCLSLSIYGSRLLGLSFIAGLFYMFNPYMMIQVWHRFVHTAIIFTAGLPFLILTWRGWVIGRSFRSLTLFLFITVLLSYSFGTLGFIITFWIALGLFSLGEVIIESDHNNLVRSGVRFLVGFSLWLLVHSWWILPLMQTGPTLTSGSVTINENLYNLVVLSKQSILPFTVQLINPFYLYNQQDFGEVFGSILFKILPWIWVSVVLAGFVHSLINRRYLYLGIALVILLFLSKGAAPPFAYFSIFVFESSKFLGVLRNTSEKIGILLPLIYSLMLVLGLGFIYQRYSVKLSKWVIHLIVSGAVLSVMIFSWPMFAGPIFGSGQKPAYIEVPEAYLQADQWIKQKEESSLSDGMGRILHLPLTRAEALTYNWEHGYSGTELNSLLFTALPSISRGFGTSLINNYLTSFSLLFTRSIFNSDLIKSQLSDYHVKYIVLHKDYRFEGSDSYDPKETEELLAKLNFIAEQVRFGELVIYSVENVDESIKTFTASKVIYVDPSSSENVLTSLSDLGYLLPTVSNDNGESQLADIKGQLNKIVVFSNSPYAELPVRRSNQEVNNFLKREGVITDYPADQITEEGLRSFKFKIPVTGTYELLMTDASSQSEYLNPFGQLNLYLNDQEVIHTGEVKGNLVSFGKYELREGELTARYGENPGKNLIPAVDVIKKYGNVLIENNQYIFTPGQTVSAIETDLESIKGGDFLKLTAKVVPQTAFAIQLFQDTDPTTIPQKSDPFGDLTTPQIYEYPADHQSQNQQNWLLYLQIRPNTQRARIRIFSANIDRVLPGATPKLVISDLKIAKILKNNLVLELELNQDNPTLTTVKSRKVSPVLYEGEIAVNQPQMFFFKEAYHPNWKLVLASEQGEKTVQGHYRGLMYANSWYLDQPGIYKFRIEFEPQNWFKKGVLISAFTGGTLLLVGLYRIVAKYK